MESFNFIKNSWYEGDILKLNNNLYVKCGKLTLRLDKFDIIKS